jgi:hypothetical protein
VSLHRDLVVRRREKTGVSLSLETRIFVVLKRIGKQAQVVGSARSPQKAPGSDFKFEP